MQGVFSLTEMGAGWRHTATLPDDDRAGVVMYPEVVLLSDQQIFLNRKKIPPGLTGFVTPFTKVATTVLTREHVPSSFQKTVIAVNFDRLYYTMEIVGNLSFLGKQTVILFWTSIDQRNVLKPKSVKTLHFDRISPFWNKLFINIS